MNTSASDSIKDRCVLDCRIKRINVKSPPPIPRPESTSTDSIKDRCVLDVVCKRINENTPRARRNNAVHTDDKIIPMLPGVTIMQTCKSLLSAVYDECEGNSSYSDVDSQGFSRDLCAVSTIGKYDVFGSFVVEVDDIDLYQHGAKLSDDFVIVDDLTISDPEKGRVLVVHTHLLDSIVPIRVNSHSLSKSCDHCYLDESFVPVNEAAQKLYRDGKVRAVYLLLKTLPMELSHIEKE